MKAYALLAAGLVIMAPFTPTPAYAAGATIAGTLGQLALPLEAIKFPVVGNVGNIVFGPPLVNLKLPLIGKAIPVVSSLSVRDAVVILQSVSAFQKPLPGLELLDATLAAAKLP